MIKPVMLRAVFFCSILLLTNPCIDVRAQIVNPIYQKTIANADGAGSDDHGYSIDYTSDGGYVIAGKTRDQFSGVGAYLVKISSAGEVEWTQVYGDEDDEYVTSVKQTPDGGYIMAGRRSMTNGSTVHQDCWLLRTNAAGGEVWNRIYGDLAEDIGHDVDLVEDNGVNFKDDGFIMTGKIRDPNTIPLWPFIPNDAAALIRVDNIGFTTWFRGLDYPDRNDVGYSVLQSDDGIIPDGIQDNGFKIAGKTEISTAVTAGPSDFLLISADIFGNGIAGFAYGGPTSTEEAYSIDQCFDYSAQPRQPSGYVLAGYTEGNLGGVGKDMYIVRVNDSGNLLWSLILDSGEDEEAYAVKHTRDGGCLITGYVDDGSVALLVVVKIDEFGAVEWSRGFGGSDGSTIGHSLVNGCHDTFVAVGWTNSADLSSTDNNVYMVNYNGSEHEVDNLSTLGTIPVQNGCIGFELSFTEAVHQTTVLHLGAPGDPGSFNEVSDMNTNHAPEHEELYTCAQCNGEDALIGRSAFQSYMGVHEDRGRHGFEANDNTFVAVGFGNGLGYQSNSDMYLMKFNSGTGDRIWAHRIFVTETTSPVDEAWFEKGYATVESNNGYIIAGSVNYEPLEPGSSVGSLDAFLVKTDTDGIVQWSHAYGNYDPSAAEQHHVEEALSLKAYDNDGDGIDEGYILAGYSNGFNPGFDTDMYLINTDADGNVNWQFVYGGDDQDTAYCVETVDDGDADHNRDDGFILAGHTESSFGGANAGGSDVYIVRTDASGAVLWDRVYGGVHNEKAGCIQQTDDDGDGFRDDGFIITGTVSDGQSLIDIYLLKIDAQGNTEWERFYTINDADLANWVEQTRDGGFILTGETFTGIIDRAQAILLKTDFCGNPIFIKQFPEREPGDPGRVKQDDEGNYVQQTEDGGYLVIGSTCTYSAQPPGENSGTGAGNVYMVKTRCDGVVCKSTDVEVVFAHHETFNPPDNGSVAVAAEGTITFPARQEALPYWEVLCTGPEFGVGKNGDNYRNPFDATSAQKAPADWLRMFPNPTESGTEIQVIIKLASAAPVTLRVFDTAGRKIYSTLRHVQAGEQSLSISTQAWGAGSFFIEALVAEMPVGQETIVIR